MTITSVGYDGTVNEVQWATLTRHLGQRYGVQSSDDFKPTIVTGVDRTVRLSTGTAFGAGVMDTSDASIDIQLPTIASGTRWDTIVLRRDWQPVGGSTTATYVSGTATQAVASGLLANPGVQDDQVIALAQVTAGTQAPTALIDMRVWASKVLTAGSLDALPTNRGTVGLIGGRLWHRDLDSGGALAWIDYMPDTGLLANVLTAASGWQIDAQQARRIGNVASFNFTIQRTGSTISSTSDGDIGNVTMATISDPTWKPSLTSSVAHNGVGRIVGMAVNTAGSLQISAMLPNISLATGTQVSGSATYFIDY